MVLHEKCCAICLLIFFNKLCNDAISTTVLIFLPVRSGNVVINNLIILFHHKRSTAVQLNCIVVPSSQQLTCIFRANFWKRAWQFWKTCATVSCVRRNYSSITAPGDNYYRSCFIYFTHVNDDDSSRSSQPRFSNHLLVRQFPEYGISNCSGSKLFEIDLIICEYRWKNFLFFQFKFLLFIYTLDR